MGQMDDKRSEILLSYRLPWWGHGMWLLASLLIIGLFLALLVWSVTRLPLVGIMIFLVELLFVAGLLIWLLLQQPLRIIVSITCTPIIMEMGTLLRKKTVVPWQGILQFKRLGAGMAFMDTYKDSYFIVPLPRSVLIGLLAKMRESSNARIVGFD